MSLIDVRANVGRDISRAVYRIGAASGKQATISAGLSSDPAAQPQQPSDQYAQIDNALKAAAASQKKQGQKGGGMQLAQPGRFSPIGLERARALFDPGRFYGVLRNAGVRGV